MPSKQAIDEFKGLYQLKYGITLSDQEAFEKASSLLSLYKTIIKKNENEQDLCEKNIKLD